MLDSMVMKKLARRKPAKRAHGKIVAAILVGSELTTKIVERIEGMGIIESFLIFTVAAFYLAVVPWGVGAYEFVAYPIGNQSRFKQGRQISFTV